MHSNQGQVVYREVDMYSLGRTDCVQRGNLLSIVGSVVHREVDIYSLRQDNLGPERLMC